MSSCVTRTPRSRSPRLAGTLVLAVLSVSALSACGHDDSDASRDGSSTASTETAPIRTAGPGEATQAWLDAYAAGDGAAVCALQTPQFSRSEIAGFDSDEVRTCEQGVAAVVEILELAVSDGDADSIDSIFSAASVEVLDQSGDTARVAIAVPDEEPDVYELSRDSGQWLISAEVDPQS